MYRLTQLPSGLRVTTVEMPHMQSVSVGLWVGVGSRCESPELNGVCHFIEHLLFKGTATRSAREISEAIEGVGGYLNAFTSEETTCFHARAGHERFGEMLDVLMDMMLHSRFAPVEIGKEREVIKEEMAMYLDEPQHQVQELLNATMWPAHPLGRPITGTGKTLDAIRRRQLLGYLQANYVAGSTVVAAAGKLTHDQVVRAVRRYEKHWKRGPRSVFARAHTEQSEPRFGQVTKKTEQTQLALGIRTCSRHDERRYALRLLNAMLGENISSRLFQELREERGLAYSIYTTPSFFADTGDLVVSAGLDADKLPKALRLIVRELRRFRESPPPAGELRRARDYVIGQIELSHESTENQMNWVGEQMLGYGRIFRPERLKARLREVTAGQISRAARDFFRPERLTLALVSPEKYGPRLAAWLRV